MRSHHLLRDTALPYPFSPQKQRPLLLIQNSYCPSTSISFCLKTNLFGKRDKPRTMLKYSALSSSQINISLKCLVPSSFIMQNPRGLLWTTIKSCNRIRFLTRELRAWARASCRYDVENSIRSLDWSIPVNFFFDFRLLSAFDSFWRAINKRNGDLCC